MNVDVYNGRISHHGYTLFELIIAVGIITIIFSFAIAGYNTFNKRERLRQAALTLKSNLRFAQTKAFSAEKPSAGCDTFSGMQVTFTLTQYSIDHLCTNGVAGESLTVDLSSGISFSSIPTPFTFISLVRKTSLPDGQSIILTNGTATYTITISGVGEIGNL